MQIIEERMEESVYERMEERMQERMEERMQESMQGSYEFKHFKTVEECDHFILNNTRLSIAYTCCGGKGVAIPKKNPPTRILIKPISIPSVKRGTCDICFIEEKSLYSTCNCCKQPFCLDCLRQIPSKVCPYCRGQLDLQGINV